MATYLILNLIVLFIVWLAISGPYRKPSPVWIIVLVVVLLLTAVFDNVIIGLKIVGYDSHKILGLFVGVAPIEDFIYAIVAVVLIPIVWNKLGSSRAK